MRKITLILSFVFFSALGAFAQLQDPISWTYAAKKISKTEAVVYIKANLDEKWHIYSQTTKPGGPTKTVFTFAPSKDYTLVGKTVEPKPIVKYEKVFNANVPYFEDEVVFQQKVKLNKGVAVVKGKVEYGVCDDKSCLPPTEFAFSIPVK